MENCTNGQCMAIRELTGLKQKMEEDQKGIRDNVKEIVERFHSIEKQILENQQETTEKLHNIEKRLTEKIAKQGVGIINTSNKLAWLISLLSAVGLIIWGVVQGKIFK